MNPIEAALERLLIPLAQALVPHLIDAVTAALQKRGLLPAEAPTPTPEGQ